MDTTTTAFRSVTRQPIEAAQHPDALLKLGTVTAITGLSSTTIYRLLADKDSGFPAAIRLGARCTRFRAGDLTAWLQAKAAK